VNVDVVAAGRPPKIEAECLDQRREVAKAHVGRVALGGATKKSGGVHGSAA